MILQSSLASTSRAHSDHDPDSAHIFRILHNLDAYGVATLIPTSHQDLFACLIVVNVSDHAVTVTVRKLDWEGLESVSLRHIVLDTMLELCCCEVTSADSLEFIVCKSCGQEVAQLCVPLRVAIVLVSAQAPHFLL